MNCTKVISMFTLNTRYLGITCRIALLLVTFVAAKNTFAMDYSVPIFQTPHVFNVGSCNYRVEPADFNADGNMDLAVTSACDDSVYVLWGDGAGNFTLSNSFHVSGLGYVISGDINADGKADIVTSNDDYNGLGEPTNTHLLSIAVFYGDGTGHFSSGQYIDLGYRPVKPAIVDV